MWKLTEGGKNIPRVWGWWNRGPSTSSWFIDYTHGRLTAGTWNWWRFGSGDFPLQLGDFEVPCSYSSGVYRIPKGGVQVAKGGDLWESSLSVFLNGFWFDVLNVFQKCLYMSDRQNSNNKMRFRVWSYRFWDLTIYLFPDCLIQIPFISFTVFPDCLIACGKPFQSSNSFNANHFKASYESQPNVDPIKNGNFLPSKNHPFGSWFDISLLRTNGRPINLVAWAPEKR